MNLIRRAEKLNSEEKEVLRYFINSISVGDIRAILDLKAKGIENPEKIIANLVKHGFLEKGEGCYNLAKPLRTLIAKRKVYI